MRVSSSLAKFMSKASKNPAQQAAIAIDMKKRGVKPKGKTKKAEVKDEDVDLDLKRGKEVILKAEDKDYSRGMLVTLLDDGGYEMAYWYDKAEPYPIEVLVDGESIKKDAKVVTMKFHPELENGEY